MKKKYILFSTSEQITNRVNNYFKWIEGEFHIEMLPVKAVAKSPPKIREQKVWDREPSPPTLSGLALYLGFDSLQTFEDYVNNGKYASYLKRARLRIENEYEKQLHHQPSTGAIFALKSLGWMEKTAEKSTDSFPASVSVKVEIIETGHAPALREQDVKL